MSAIEAWAIKAPDGEIQDGSIFRKKTDAINEFSDYEGTVAAGDERKP